MRGIGTGLLAVVIAAGTMMPAFADEAADVAAIKSRTAALGQAFVSRDAATIRAMMTPDHRAVAFIYKGPQTVDEEVASLPQLKMEIYDAIPPTVALLGPDAALVTYEQSYRGTFNGNPLPGRVFVGEVWVRIDGKWLQKFYQETVMELE